MKPLALVVAPVLACVLAPATVRGGAFWNDTDDVSITISKTSRNAYTDRFATLARICFTVSNRGSKPLVHYSWTVTATRIGHSTKKTVKRTIPEEFAPDKDEWSVDTIVPSRGSKDVCGYTPTSNTIIPGVEDYLTADYRLEVEVETARFE